MEVGEEVDKEADEKLNNDMEVGRAEQGLKFRIESD